MSVRQFPPVSALSFGIVPPAPVSFGHAWWRLNITAKNGSTVVAVGELEFRATVGGADQANGGTASASGTFSGFTPGGAFDNTGTTAWASASSALPQWIAYHFTAPVVVKQILVMSRDSGASDQNPTAWDVQFSDDGTTWTTAWSNTTASAWAANESRTFNSP